MLSHTPGSWTSSGNYSYSFLPVLDQCCVSRPFLWDLFLQRAFHVPLNWCPTQIPKEESEEMLMTAGDHTHTERQHGTRKRWLCRTLTHRGTPKKHSKRHIHTQNTCTASIHTQTHIVHKCIEAHTDSDQNPNFVSSVFQLWPCRIHGGKYDLCQLLIGSPVRTLCHVGTTLAIPVKERTQAPSAS